MIVGAPFEGRGAIYIYRGSSVGINPEYSQRIAASDLQSAPTLQSRPLTSFGYSLSAGMDVDGNGYPDMVVGSFQSDIAVVLRSRPVLNVVTKLHAHPSPIDPFKTQCIQDGLPFNCFKLKACLRYTIHPAHR